MSVETWDPGSPNSQVSEKKLRRLLDAARLLSEPRFGLDSSEILENTKNRFLPYGSLMDRL